LAGSVCCDWSTTASVFGKCHAPFHKRKFHHTNAAQPGLALSLKGILHQKMKILSSCILSMSFFLLLNTKEDILKNDWNSCLAPLTSIVFWNSCLAPLTSIVFVFYYGSQWCQTTVWFQSISKWWQNFHFWVKYPFKRELFKWGILRRVHLQKKTQDYNRVISGSAY